MSFVKDTVFMFFPPQSTRGKWLKKRAQKLNLAKPYVFDPAYQHWIDNVETYSFLAPIENSDVESTELPFLSIVIPMFNTKDKYLIPLLHSIINQSYSHWELILADASTSPERAAVIKQAASQDPRLRYYKLKKNEGISGNTNQGLKYVKGDYVVFMDHDDTINPHALNEVAAAIVNDKKIEIIYSDEDKLTDDGTARHTPHFKPDWSPHQYLSCNWTSHLSVIKTGLVNEVNGLRPEMDGSQDYDLILRLHALKGERVVKHVPKVLYHWRVADGSTAGSVGEKSYAVVAGEKALTNYVSNKGWNCTVKSIDNRPGFFKLVFKPKVDRKTLVILNGSNDKDLNTTLLGRLKSSSSSSVKTKFVTIDEFNHNKQRLLDGLSDDDHIFSINGYYTTLDTKWIDDLSGVLELDDVRAVSPLILTTRDLIKDMGIVIDGNGQEKELFRQLHRHAGTMFGHVEWVRDVARVTGRFYGAKKVNWAKLNDKLTVGGDRDMGSKKYDVVWSHVTFRYITENTTKNVMFNQNLNVDDCIGIPSL